MNNTQIKLARIASYLYYKYLIKLDSPGRIFSLYFLIERFVHGSMYQFYKQHLEKIDKKGKFLFHLLDKMFQGYFTQQYKTFLERIKKSRPPRSFDKPFDPYDFSWADIPFPPKKNHKNHQ